MAVKLPSGAHIAVTISLDFCAHSLWMGMFNSTSQGHLSRGEFGAEVGVPRVLEFLAERRIPATWCIPGHSVVTFPAQCREIMAVGHEIATHGLYHEKLDGLPYEEERRLLELQLQRHEEVLGRRPKGYRSPSWEHTPHTLELLEEFGFVWDSSLMGRDFTPYHPRTVTVVDREHGNQFAAPSPVLEFPVSWFLDDFPALESIPRSVDMQSTETVLRRWTDHFDFAYHRVDRPHLTLTLHPQTVGRAHVYLMVERFLDHVSRHDGVWFATLEQVAEAWVDDPA